MLPYLLMRGSSIAATVTVTTADVICQVRADDTVIRVQADDVVIQVRRDDPVVNA